MYSSPFVSRHDYACEATAAVTASQSREALCEDLDPCADPLAAPLADPSGTHANIRGERDAEFPRHWAQVERLSKQLQRTLQEEADFMLVGDQLNQVQRALAQADLTMLPPDRRGSLHPWTQTLNSAIRGVSPGVVPELRVKHEDLEELAGLLQETLVTSSKLECGEWVPLKADDRAVLRELANWMQGGSVAQLHNRCEVGRQLLLQSGALISDIHFGSDTETPELPDMHVVHALVEASTRADVSLGGGIDKTLRLEYPLAALPLRTWRLGDAQTLAWVVNQQPADLRTLDLRPWKGSLAGNVEAGDLLRRAGDELPNLAEILLPERASADALSGDWTARKGNGWQYIRRDRPDGLALLDAAVAAWEGMVVGTCMAIRRKASQPDAAELLKLAKSMAPFRHEWVANALRQILNGAARSDEVMHRCADAYRAAREHTRAPEVHLRLTEKELHAVAEAERQQPSRPSQPPRVLTPQSSSRSSPLSPSSPLGPLSPTEKAPGPQASKSSGRSGSVMSLASLLEQHGLRSVAHRSAAHVDDGSDATETGSAGFESDTEGSFTDSETASTTSTKSARSFTWRGGAMAGMGLPPQHRVDTAPHLLSRRTTPGQKPLSLPASKAMEVPPPARELIQEKSAKVVILPRGKALSAQQRDEPMAPGLAHASGATPWPARPFLSTFFAPKRPAPEVPKHAPVRGAMPATVPVQSVPLQTAALQEAEESFDFETMRKIIGRKLHATSDAT